MPYLRAFGYYVPSRVVENAELAAMVGVDPAWLLQSTGIEQRRYAAPDETVASLAVAASKDCLANAGMSPQEVGLIIAASGSAERRFPGPGPSIGAALGIAGVPALDLPMASAGSLFGLALASQLCSVYRNVLVIGAEIMSRVVRLDAAGRDTAILFGDGAGACIVSDEAGFARIADSLLASDGEFAGVLQLDFNAPVHMDGRSVILHASRKIPRAISELLERNRLNPADVGAFVMHQANLNLITRVAKTLGVAEEKFYRNVARYGNTSSASMLIASAEMLGRKRQRVEAPVVFAAFGAGLNWGAVLAL